MKKKKRMIRQGVFWILSSILFALFSVNAAAIDTPWITPPEESGAETLENEVTTEATITSETTITAETTITSETTITAETSAIRETATVEDDSSPEIPIAEITASEGETPSEPPTGESTGEAGPKKERGCGSMILQSGFGCCAAIFAITTIFCFKREEKSHGAS